MLGWKKFLLGAVLLVFFVFMFASLGVQVWKEVGRGGEGREGRRREGEGRGRKRGGGGGGGEREEKGRGGKREGGGGVEDTYYATIFAVAILIHLQL